MTKPSQFFQDNVEKYATNTKRPLEYNEQRGFLAMAKTLERLESHMKQIEQEQSALRALLASR